MTEGGSAEKLSTAELRELTRRTRAVVAAPQSTMSKVYRIYTEDLNRSEVLRLAAAKFESFTLHPATGYFRGKAEASLVIEIVRAEEVDVQELARSIRRLNGQKSVLIMNLSGEAHQLEA